MKSSSQVYKRARPALGTTLELSLSAPDFGLAQAALTNAFGSAARLELVLSVFDPTSELARINRTPVGEASALSEDLARVLHLGAELERRSEGAFRLMPSSSETALYSLAARSVTRKTDAGFDLGGIAKGYIVDRLFEELEAGFPGETIVVNAGGDVRTSHAVNTEIRVPGESGEKRYAIALERGALATSSRMGTSAVGTPSARFAAETAPFTVGSAAVFAADCATADAFTKVVLFGDPSRREELLPGGAQVFAFSPAGDPL